MAILKSGPSNKNLSKNTLPTIFFHCCFETSRVLPWHFEKSFSGSQFECGEMPVVWVPKLQVVSFQPHRNVSHREFQIHSEKETQLNLNSFLNEYSRISSLIIHHILEPSNIPWGREIGDLRLGIP